MTFDKDHGRGRPIANRGVRYPQLVATKRIERAPNLQLAQGGGLVNPLTRRSVQNTRIRSTRIAYIGLI